MSSINSNGASNTDRLNLIRKQCSCMYILWQYKFHRLEIEFLNECFINGAKIIPILYLFKIYLLMFYILDYNPVCGKNYINSFQIAYLKLSYYGGHLET